MTITEEPDELLHKVRIRLSPSNLPRDKGTFIARTESEKMLSYKLLKLSVIETTIPSSKVS